jgi:hypothetical protein
MAKGLKIGLVKAFATTEGTPLRPALSVKKSFGWSFNIS